MPSEAISCQLTLMSYLLSATSCQLPEYFKLLSRLTHELRLTTHSRLTTYSQFILRLRSAQATFTTHNSHSQLTIHTHNSHSQLTIHNLQFTIHTHNSQLTSARFIPFHLTTNTFTPSIYPSLTNVNV